MDQFVLKFLGPTDSSPEAVNRLKDGMVNRLGLSPETVTRLFNKFPTVIKRGPDRNVLERYGNALRTLGANIEIEDPPPSNQPSGVSLEHLMRMLEDDGPSSEPTSPPAPAPSVTPQQSQIVELNFDSSEPEVDAATIVPPTPTQSVVDDTSTSTNTLDLTFDSETDVPHESQPAAKEVLPPAQPEAKSEPPAEFSFDTNETDEAPLPTPEPAPAPKPTTPKQVMVESNALAPIHTADLTKVENAAKIVTDNVGNEPTLDALAAPAEFSDFELDTPLVLPKSTSWKAVSRTQAIGITAVAVMIIALGVLNPFGFGASNEKDRISRVISSTEIRKLLAKQKRQPAVVAPMSNEDKRKPRPANLQNWRYVGSSGIIKAEIELLMEEKNLFALDINLTGSPPEKLTIEQLAKGEVQRPWMRELQAIEVRAEKNSSAEIQSPEIQFVASGVGRAYLEDAKGSSRTIAPVTVRGKLNPETREITASWEVSRGELPEGTQKPYSERTTKGGFSFIFGGDLLLTYQGAPTPAPNPESTRAPAVEKPTETPATGTTPTASQKK